MASSSSSPTARRWELAARLRVLREAAGKSIEDVAAELMCSHAKISRMETGGRGIQPRDIRDLCRFYGVSDKVRSELMELDVEARKRGWWQDYRSIDEQTATFVGLESAAADMGAVEARVIQGLLQTPEMTRSILSGMRSPGELTTPWIEETVELRQRRQKRVLSGELHLGAILDESVFARRFAPPGVALEQVDHLLEVAELPNVTIQVVPFEVGAYPGVDGSFQYLRFASPDLADVVYVEGLLGNFTLDKESSVRRYVEIYNHIAETAALDPDATRLWLANLRKEIRSGSERRRQRG
jgi:transcriptional regulator with XRE-family HTH domain